MIKTVKTKKGHLKDFVNVGGIMAAEEDMAKEIK